MVPECRLKAGASSTQLWGRRCATGWWGAQVSKSRTNPHCSFILGISPVPFKFFSQIKLRTSSYAHVFVIQPVRRAQGKLLQWKLSPTSAVLCTVISISGAPSVAKTPQHSSCEHRITIRVEHCQLTLIFLTPLLVQAIPQSPRPQMLDSQPSPSFFHLFCEVRWNRLGSC